MTTRTIHLPALPHFGNFRPSDALKSLRQVWQEATRAAASRRNLARLDDRMLADIGISASQAEFEASRWH